MRAKTTRHRIIFYATGLALAFVAIAVSGLIAIRTRPEPQQSLGAATSQQLAKVSVPATGKSKLLYKQDFGNWNYQALQDDAQNSWIAVNYDHSSPGALRAYVATNKALIPQLERDGGPVEVAISFLSLLQPDRFRAWAKQQGLQTREVQLAAGNGTLGIAGTKDDPLPQEAVQSFPYVGMGGVFGVYGTVDASRLSSIASDPVVYLLDVTPAWSRRILKQAGVSIADQPKTKVQVDLAYGWMKSLGMISTPVAVPGPLGTAVPQILAPAP